MNFLKMRGDEGTHGWPWGHDFLLYRDLGWLRRAGGVGGDVDGKI
jgi:hypothetical protein